MRRGISKWITAFVAGIVVFALPNSAGATTAATPPPQISVGSAPVAGAPAEAANGKSGANALVNHPYWFRFANDYYDNPERCILGQGLTLGNPVTQYDCLGYPDQRWAMVDMNPGIHLQNLNAAENNLDLCLTTQGGVGGVATLYTCGIYIDQRWVLDYDTVKNNGHFMLKRLGTNPSLCLAAPGANGSQLSVWECNSSFGDQWWHTV